MKSIQEIEDDAADWVIRIETGRGSRTLERDWVAWLKADPMHRKEFFRLWGVWQEVNELNARPQASSVRIRSMAFCARPQVALVVVAIGAAIVAMGSIWPAIGWRADKPAVAVSEPDLVRETPIGRNDRFELPDGSVIQLNTQTKITAKLTPSARRVTVLRGEARFAVTHDPSRQFVVSAGKFTVRALGTEFTVKHIDVDDAPEVVVTDGRVTVDGDTAGSRCMAAGVKLPAVLSSREMLAVEDGCLAIRNLSDEELQRKVSWTQGLLVFVNEPLKNIVTELNRYTHRRLVILDPNIGEEHVTASIKVQEPGSFLQAINRGLGVRVLPPSKDAPNEDRLVGRTWKAQK